MKLFSILFDRLARPVDRHQAHHCGEERWLADPLSHPDLARMDERQLADLPLPRNLPAAVVQAESTAFFAAVKREATPRKRGHHAMPCPAV